VLFEKRRPIKGNLYGTDRATETIPPLKRGKGETVG